ncbi:MAG: hypothetical protein ABR879_05130 [Methanomassiliicoccales archaeon]
MSGQANQDKEDAVRMGKASGQDAIYTSVHNLTIFECSVNVFRASMKEVGPVKALAAVKPYMNFAGKWYAGAATQRFGKQGNDVEAVAMPYYWVHYGTSCGHCKPMEIRDGKAIIELYACPTTVVGAPPEICIAMSHYLAEGLCEAINPAYEFVFTHHLANGDDRCRYVVKKKSDKFSLDNPGRLEKTIPLDLSQGEVDTLMESVAFGGLEQFIFASIDAIGSQRTLELVVPAARNTGLRLGTKLMRDAGGKKDLLALRDGLDCICSPLSQIASSALVTESGIEKEITECPFKQWFPPNWQSAAPQPEICAQMEAVLSGVCEAMNPDYEFAFDRMMSKGDKTCHWVVRKKAVGKGTGQQEPMSDDSLGY